MVKRKNELIDTLKVIGIIADKSLSTSQLIRSFDSDNIYDDPNIRCKDIMTILAGYLYDEDVSLSALGILSNEKKFMWKGNQIGKKFVEFLDYYGCYDPELINDDDEVPTMFERLICASRDIIFG